MRFNLLMTESILKVVSSFVGWLAAKGIDRILSRWLATFIIAWENKASEAARKEFADAIQELKQNMPEKYSAWEEWRKRVSQT